MGKLYRGCPPLDLILYRYNVTVSPTAQGKKLSQLVRLLLETEELLKFTLEMVSDFMVKN